MDVRLGELGGRHGVGDVQGHTVHGRPEVRHTVEIDECLGELFADRRRLLLVGRPTVEVGLESGSHRRPSGRLGDVDLQNRLGRLALAERESSFERSGGPGDAFLDGCDDIGTSGRGRFVVNVNAVASDPHATDAIAGRLGHDVAADLLGELVERLLVELAVLGVDAGECGVEFEINRGHDGLLSGTHQPK